MIYWTCEVYLSNKFNIGYFCFIDMICMFTASLKVFFLQKMPLLWQTEQQTSFFPFDNHVFSYCPGRILNSLSANSGLLPIFFLHTLQSTCYQRVFKTYVFWRPFVLLLPSINHRSQSLFAITFLPMTRSTCHNFELFIEAHSSQPMVVLFFL